MMVMVVVVIIVVMMMMVMVIVVMMIVMMIVMMVMVMVVILGYNHWSFFRHSRIIASCVLCPQDLLGIGDGLQQLGK